MRRNFSTRQRNILLWISGGKCSICGVKLSSSFHADHVKAYANGGSTLLSNGQALCATCNLRKGKNDN